MIAKANYLLIAGRKGRRRLAVDLYIYRLKLKAKANYSVMRRGEVASKFFICYINRYRLVWSPAAM
jgi:hypothetical protein